jgi:ABC-type phosphate/phosphonate transport system substrate-binding protein
MKKIIYSLIIYFVLISSVYAQNVNNGNQINENKLILIFAKNSFHNIKTEDAIATAQILANHIKKIKNIKQDFDVKLAENDNEIFEKCKNNFDIVLLTTEQYLKLKSKLPIVAFCTNYTDGNYGFIYHLIVNKNSAISDITQLKEETIYVQAHSKDQAATLWLNKLLKDKSAPPAEKFFGNIIVDSKAPNVLLPVFFKKAKACIVTNSSLKLLLELNPGIKDQIKIISTSEPIILGITCLNANKKNEDVYKILEESLLTLQENEYGKQMLDLFRAEKLILFKEEYLKSYFNLIKQQK